MSATLTATERVVNRIAVLHTYRHLLRSTRIAFTDDEPTLKAARTFARQQFRDGKRLEPGGVEAGHGIEHAQGVSLILRENVVQGR